LIPTSEWKEKRFGVPWQEGENLSIAVGQGYDVVTPIQNAMLAAQVANGGKRLSLHLVDAAYSVDGEEVYKWEPPADLEDLPIDKEVLKIVKEGMEGATKPGGTAGRLSAFKVPMGGKTGTAQVVSLDAACVGEKCRDHGWFIGFAPTDKPEIAAAAVVEHGGFGSGSAAPIVGEMMQRYYDIVHGTADEEEKGKEEKIKKKIRKRITESVGEAEAARHEAPPVDEELPIERDVEETLAAPKEEAESAPGEEGR
jgi:penicillin-binding protein 2